MERARFSILEIVTGNRAAETGKKLWKKVKDIKKTLYTSYELKAYKKFLPQNKHIADKSQTTNIESSNANIRHYLIRFSRNTKCYSKYEEMVILSLYLL